MAIYRFFLSWHLSDYQYNYPEAYLKLQRQPKFRLCQDLVGGTPGLRKIIFILSREGSNLGDFP